MKKIIAISGSLRKESLNTSVVASLQELMPEGVTLEMVTLENVPLFNEDNESSFPEGARAFKEKVLEADAIIISTPEYNRSMPGVLKNAIDWASRPYGKNAFAGKPVLVMGATGGSIGTALAQYHLKQVLTYLDVKLVGQPELYIGQATDKIKDGKLVDEATKDHIRKAVDVLLAK